MAFAKAQQRCLLPRDYLRIFLLQNLTNHLRIDFCRSVCSLKMRRLLFAAEPYKPFTFPLGQGMNLCANLSGVERQKLCSMTEVLWSQRWKKCKVYLVSNILSHQRKDSVACLINLQSHFLWIFPFHLCVCVSHFLPQSPHSICVGVLF